MTRLTPVVLLFGIAVAGCSSDAPSTAGVSIRDSSGIRIILNAAPLWSSNAPNWTLDSIPGITIEGGPRTAEYFLDRVRAVQRTEEGLIVVANSGGRQVLMFDSLGNFIEGIGGPGDGPGEFSSMFGLYQCAGDTLIVYEGVRLSMLDSRGAFVRTELIAGRLAGGRGNLEGIANDCSAVLLVEARERPPRPGEGVHQLATTLYWSALDGSARVGSRRSNERALTERRLLLSDAHEHSTPRPSRGARGVRLTTQKGRSPGPSMLSSTTS